MFVCAVLFVPIFFSTTLFNTVRGTCTLEAYGQTLTKNYLFYFKLSVVSVELDLSMVLRSSVGGKSAGYMCPASAADTCASLQMPSSLARDHTPERAAARKIRRISFYCPEDDD